MPNIESYKEMLEMYELYKKEKGQRQILEEFEKNPDSYPSETAKKLSYKIIEETIRTANLETDAKVERLKKFVNYISKSELDVIFTGYVNKELLEKVLKDPKLCNYISTEILFLYLEEKEKKQILEEFEKNPDSYPSEAARGLSYIIFEETIDNAILKSDAEIERLKKSVKYLSINNMKGLLKGTLKGNKPTEECKEILQNEIRKRAEKDENQDVVQKQAAEAIPNGKITDETEVPPIKKDVDENLQDKKDETVITETEQTDSSETTTEINQNQVGESELTQDAAQETGQIQENKERSTDPMLMAAIETALEAGQASTSLLQRRLRVGYTRAGKLIEEMEKRGIVSEHKGAHPRDVLITEEELNEFKNKQKGERIDELSISHEEQQAEKDVVGDILSDENVSDLEKALRIKEYIDNSDFNNLEQYRIGAKITKFVSDFERLLEFAKTLKSFTAIKVNLKYILVDKIAEGVKTKEQLLERKSKVREVFNDKDYEELLEAKVQTELLLRDDIEQKETSADSTQQQEIETVQEKVAEKIADNQEGQQVLIDETVIPEAAEQVIGIETGEEIIEDTAQNDLAQKVEKIFEELREQGELDEGLSNIDKLERINAKLQRNAFIDYNSETIAKVMEEMIRNLSTLHEVDKAKEIFGWFIFDPYKENFGKELRKILDERTNYIIDNPINIEQEFVTEQEDKTGEQDISNVIFYQNNTEGDEPKKVQDKKNAEQKESVNDAEQQQPPVELQEEQPEEIYSNGGNIDTKDMFYASVKNILEDEELSGVSKVQGILEKMSTEFKGLDFETINTAIEDVIANLSDFDGLLEAGKVWGSWIGQDNITKLEESVAQKIGEGVTTKEQLQQRIDDIKKVLGEQFGKSLEESVQGILQQLPTEKVEEKFEEEPAQILEEAKVITQEDSEQKSNENESQFSPIVEEILADKKSSETAKVEKICERLDDFSEKKEAYEAEIREIIKTFTSVEGLSLGLYNLGAIMDKTTRGEVEANLAQKLVESCLNQEELQKKLTEIEKFMDIKTRSRIEAMIQEKIAQNSSGETKKNDTNKEEHTDSKNSQDSNSTIDRICSLEDIPKIREELLKHPELVENPDSDIYKKLVTRLKESIKKMTYEGNNSLENEYEKIRDDEKFKAEMMDSIASVMTEKILSEICLKVIEPKKVLGN